MSLTGQRPWPTAVSDHFHLDSTAKCKDEWVHAPTLRAIRCRVHYGLILIWTESSELSCINWIGPVWNGLSSSYQNDAKSERFFWTIPETGMESGSLHLPHFYPNGGQSLIFQSSLRSSGFAV